MKKSPAGCVAVIVLLLAGGCGPTPPRPAQTNGPVIVGVVRNEDAVPLGDWPVQGCTTKTCLTTMTDQRGRFSIAGLNPPADVAIKTPENATTTPISAEAIAPVVLADRSNVDAGTLYVPKVAPPVTVPSAGTGPHTVTLGDGLVLALRREDLAMPLGANRDDQLSARSIPLAHVPALRAISPETVVAAYAFYPFGARSRSRMGVRMPTSLPAGTAVRLRTINELNGTLSGFEPGRSDGTFVTTDPGAGILELTWLIVSSPR